VPPLGGLGATYDVHIRLIRKRIVDFLLVLIKHFLLGVTAEELRANISSSSTVKRWSIEGDYKYLLTEVVMCLSVL